MSYRALCYRALPYISLCCQPDVLRDVAIITFSSDNEIYNNTNSVPPSDTLMTTVWLWLVFSKICRMIVVCLYNTWRLSNTRNRSGRGSGWVIKCRWIRRELWMMFCGIEDWRGLYTIENREWRAIQHERLRWSHTTWRVEGISNIWQELFK